MTHRKDYDLLEKAPNINRLPEKISIYQKRYQTQKDLLKRASDTNKLIGKNNNLSKKASDTNRCYGKTTTYRKRHKTQRNSPKKTSDMNRPILKTTTHQKNNDLPEKAQDTHQKEQPRGKIRHCQEITLTLHFIISSHKLVAHIGILSIGKNAARGCCR